MPNNIEIQQAPINNNLPESFFRKNDFDNLIFNSGYDIIIEKALRCPCKSKGSDNLSNCRNCCGTGWLFINSIQTKAILMSQNLQTQFKNWTEANMGNVNISVRDIDRLSFMDRITVLQSESIHSQIVYPVNYQNTCFAFLNYKPKEVFDCFMFYKHDEKLIKLDVGIDYSIDGTKIIFSSNFSNIQDFTVTLRYTHSVQYHIIDIKRDIIVTNSLDYNGNKSKQQMPVSAVGRRSHYVLDAQNFEGNYVLNNSYVKDNCATKTINVSGYCINAEIVASLPNTTNKYKVVYDTSTDTFKYFNGNNWIDLGA